MHYQLIIFDWEGTIVDPAWRLTTVRKLRSNHARSVEVYPGVTRVLGQLKENGFKLAIATGKGRRGLDRELTALHINDLFDCTRTPDETFPKPNPAMLLEILDELQVNAAGALMVGDSPLDLAMAREAHVDAVGVCYGPHTQAQLMPYSAKAYIATINELLDFLKIMEK